MLNKKKILIVEDDELLRETLAVLLKKKYDVSQAVNGKEAKHIIMLKQFDLILSDIQMPFFTGIDLLEWVKLNHPTKFILMTGFSHILETHKAADMGADDFLSKPFEEKHLIEKIDRLIGVQEPAEVAPPVNQDELYCKVPIDDFVADKEFEYDLYLKINDGKYLKIAHKGGKIPQYRANAYKEKGIHFFYVHKDDFSKLVSFTLFFSKVVAGSAQIDKEKKERFLRYTGEMIVQNTFINGIDKTTYSLAKDFTQLSLNSLTEEPSIYNLLHNLNEHADYIYAHSLAVSTFSVMIAHALGWTRPAMLFKLSLAGLFHDIGKKEIPRAILEKSRAELTLEERKLIETHPLRGKEILESMHDIPSEVVTVAFEHHENIIGSGYPRQIAKIQIHPLTHIVSVANVFANLTIKNPKITEPVESHEAIILMEKKYKDLLDPAAFEALKTVVNSQK